MFSCELSLSIVSSSVTIFWLIELGHLSDNVCLSVKKVISLCFSGLDQKEGESWKGETSILVEKEKEPLLHLIPKLEILVDGNYS